MIRLKQNNGTVVLIGDRTHQIATTLPFCSYTSAIHNPEVKESPLNYLTLQTEKGE
ncbi:hypothetical protein [[Phormidium ambiguum] IAM M-71]|uniref:hypothetical protein n=1 Tax=[Phormidium ambiguum] IAM M-71 TaxID=454136 RepID=UPI0015BF2A69|nr:hypothetical protein [Phormidium ambiguum]